METTYEAGTHSVASTNLRMLAACYRKAMKDSDARVPSYLQAAIIAITGEQSLVMGDLAAQRAMHDRYAK